MRAWLPSPEPRIAAQLIPRIAYGVRVVSVADGGVVVEVSERSGFTGEGLKLVEAVMGPRPDAARNIIPLPILAALTAGGVAVAAVYCRVVDPSAGFCDEVNTIISLGPRIVESLPLIAEVLAKFLAAYLMGVVVYKLIDLAANR